MSRRDAEKSRSFLLDLVALKDKSSVGKKNKRTFTSQLHIYSVHEYMYVYTSYGITSTSVFSCNTDIIRVSLRAKYPCRCVYVWKVKRG